MPYTWTRRSWRVACLSSLMVLVVVFAACGGAGTSISAPADNSGSISRPVNVDAAAGNGSSQPQTSKSQGSVKSASSGVQYLVKTLKVAIQIDDTKKAADDLQAWITTTDPHATSSAINYDRIGENTYTISMTFSVQASIYPQVLRYLRDYAPQQKGHLLNFNESVQDVTGDYVDTQSRLKNLRAEQGRLLDLMSHATAMGDVIALEQRLSDVESEIESIEAHFNDLTNQVSFYTVSIVLQPSGTTPPPSTGWNPGQILHDAWAASLTFAQALGTFLIWLLAYSIYIVPAGLLLFWFMGWRKRRTVAAIPSILVPAPASDPPPPAQPPVTAGTP